MSGRPGPRSRSWPRVAEPTAVPGRFGEFGGQYVPETLMPALEELQAALATSRSDPAFAAELDALNRDFGGRPTPLYLAERISEQAGEEVWFKREDLLHTGAH